MAYRNTLFTYLSIVCQDCHVLVIFLEEPFHKFVTTVESVKYHFPETAVFTRTLDKQTFTVLFITLSTARSAMVALGGFRIKRIMFADVAIALRNQQIRHVEGGPTLGQTAVNTSLAIQTLLSTLQPTPRTTQVFTWRTVAFITLTNKVCTCFNVHIQLTRSRFLLLPTIYTLCLRWP
jgi:hypothetical protein